MIKTKKPKRAPKLVVLNTYEKLIDKKSNINSLWISSGDKFETRKNEMKNAGFKENSPNDQKQIVQIPKSIFKKFQQVMEKANIPYSVL